mmetsp:Transcript_111369/g.255405  ORF Transcript_111369/g.255405 Transcript_111369/m.255405 type:complete len:248 (+) Transcript_111369:911-1654(+)
MDFLQLPSDASSATHFHCSRSLQRIDQRAFPDVGVSNHPHTDGHFPLASAGVVLEQLHQGVRTQHTKCAMHHTIRSAVRRAVRRKLSLLGGLKGYRGKIPAQVRNPLLDNLPRNQIDLIEDYYHFLPLGNHLIFEQPVSARIRVSGIQDLQDHVSDLHHLPQLAEERSSRGLRLCPQPGLLDLTLLDLRRDIRRLPGLRLRAKCLHWVHNARYHGYIIVPVLVDCGTFCILLPALNCLLHLLLESLL